MTTHRDLPSKRGLVLDAIAHRESNRIPFAIQFQATIGRRLAAHYGVNSIGEVVDGCIEFIGNAPSPPRMAELGMLEDGEYTDEWGIRWKGVGETRGQVKISPLATPSLEGHSFPPQRSPEIIRTMKAQAEESRHRYRVAKLGALWEQATFLRGMEELLVDLVLHPGFVHQLLDRILEVLLAEVELYSVELDIEAMWLSDDYGSQFDLLMSPAQWREFIRPRVQRLGDAVHATGHHFVVHSDGAIGAVIPDLVDLGVDILHPVQTECVDVAWVKREFGRHLTIWGGYGSQGSLVFGTPDQIGREVDQQCDVLGAGGGFILSPGLSIQNEVPIENVVAFIETALAREQGRS